LLLFDPRRVEPSGRIPDRWAAAKAPSKTEGDDDDEDEEDDEEDEEEL
jgi:hypothetical protein